MTQQWRGQTSQEYNTFIDLGTKCFERINCLITKDFEQDLSLETNKKGERNIRHTHNNAYTEQVRIHRRNLQV